MNIERLKELFSYDPETGLLYWRARGRGRIKKKPAGTLLSTGYVGIVADGKRLLAHRICWAIANSKEPADQIDHINGVRIDNRICNLREAKNSQNGKNMSISKRNTSGVSGVSFDKINQKWRAYIRVDGVHLNLGRWPSIKQAKLARIGAEKKYFGEWARSKYENSNQRHQ